MTTLFVSRHPGAIAWMKKQNIQIDQWEEHLDIETLKAGDTVIGILPLHTIAQLCERKIQFYALTMNVKRTDRGQELSAQQLDDLNCRLVRYHVQLVEDASV